jgi:hypothetical protein
MLKTFYVIAKSEAMKQSSLSSLFIIFVELDYPAAYDKSP